MNDFKRATRVSEDVRVVLSNLLTEGLKDPDLGFVTITGVKMGDDLRQARVYVSIYGNDKVQQASLRALTRARSFLRHEVGQRLTLRHVPELSFFTDDSISHGARIESLLQKIARGEAVDHESENANTGITVDTGRSRQSLGEHLHGTPLPQPQKPTRPYSQRTKSRFINKSR